MSHGSFIVPPRSIANICAAAERLRRGFAPLISERGYLRVDVMLDLMDQFIPDFRFEVCTHQEMGNDHGRTFPAKRLVQLREDVYDGMCRGQGRDRFTTCHELGHLFLHDGVAFARAMQPTTKIYYSSEWQANTFASALLIGKEHLQLCRTLDEVMVRFGVSQDAARVRFKR